MPNVKKIGIFATLVLAGAAVALGFAKQSFHEAKADGWSEELSAVNLVIGYGKAVHNDSTADYVTAASGKYSYFVRHGYLTNNKNKKYDNVSSTDGYTANAKFTSNTATDSICDHWQFKINGGKLAEDTEDGVILGFIANAPMTYSIDTMTFKGWPNSGIVNTYVKRAGINAYLSVQSVTIANTSTQYSQSAVALNIGDTVYFEYIQLSGTGNLQQTSGSGLPVFKLNEYGSEKIEKTITTTSIARDYYNNGLAHDSTVDLVDDATLAFKVGVRHGKIEANNVIKFDTVTNTSGNITYADSTDTDVINARITYGKSIWSGNDDGVIFMVQANKPITFSSVAKTFGGWQDNVYLTYAIKENGSSTYNVVAKEYYHGSTNSGETKAVNPILLQTGDTMYFEFRFPWSVTATNNRRSIQDNSDAGTVPTFVLSENNVTAVSTEANTFMAKFMKLATVATTDEGTGKCISAGWYTAAKAAFNAMSADARALFLSDAAYADGAARLVAWATANGDTLNGSNILAKASNNPFGIAFADQNNNSNLFVIIIATTLMSITLISCLIIIKKRKHQ